MSQIKINRRNPIKDFANIVFFVAAVACGIPLMNTFVFRGYSIYGSSMEPTFHQGDHVIVDRLSVTWSQIANKTYIPKRGEIIVFEHPDFNHKQQDRFLIKRVIGLPGDRVSVKDGKITVYNEQRPEGFNPDESFNDKLNYYVSGNVDNEKVLDGHIFVVGDHRDGSHSKDSRNGLGQVPIYNISGPVRMRILPVKDFRFFN